MPSGISVIICCFNSSTRITPTLLHLYNQKDIPLSSWEIIVVNNCSTDNTVEKVGQLWESLPSNKPGLSIVNELTPGLSAARQKGITESYFDYVLFCDDDNWLDENYLSLALNIMQNNPLIGALGGTGIPVFEKSEPPYFWVNQYHVLAVGNQSGIDGDITDERGVLYGAGLVLNKDAYNALKEKFQFKFLLSDRIGDNLASSGDHELCLALRKIGFRIFYSKSLKFKHYIPENRTTISYYKKLFLGFGTSDTLLHVYNVNKANLNNIKHDYRYMAVRCVKNILLTRIKLLISGYPFDDDKFKYLDHLHFLYSNLGQLRTTLKIKNLYKKQLLTLPLFYINS
jgi:glycosyltransferase involved in cell wall biosynthesis